MIESYQLSRKYLKIKILKCYNIDKMVVGQLTNTIINKCITEIKKKNNMKKIHTEILDPILCYMSSYINRRIYPFVLIMTVIFILTFILAIIILVTLMRKL